MKPGSDEDRPCVRVALFARAGRCYAFFDQDSASDELSTADWESEPIQEHPIGSSHWYIHAFNACLLAYRRLQARHPDKDLVLTADECGLGIAPFAFG
jgi:hypothetical protein